MKTFAVGIMSLHDNELNIELIQAETWREATLKHPKSFWNALAEDNPDDFEAPEDAENEILNIVPETISEAKQKAFDFDGGFDCVEVPNIPEEPKP